MVLRLMQTVAGTARQPAQPVNSAALDLTAVVRFARLVAVAWQPTATTTPKMGMRQGSIAEAHARSAAMENRALVIMIACPLYALTMSALVQAVLMVS